MFHFDVGGHVTYVGAGDGELWAIRGAGRALSDVVRVDPDSGRVVGSPVRMRGAGVGVAVGEGAVWVAANVSGASGSLDRGVLVRVDRNAHRVAARIPLGRGATGVAVGEGGVWVTSPVPGSVSRVDPSTDRVISTVPVGEGARRVLTGAGSVWVESEHGGLHRIDPATNEVTATRKVLVEAVGQHAVWVTGRWEREFGLRRLDPSTLRPLGPVLSSDIQPASVVVAGQGLWVGRDLYYCRLHNPLPEGPPIVAPGWLRLDPVTLRALSGPTFVEASSGSGSHVYVAGAIWIATDLRAGLIKIDLAIAGRVRPTPTPGLPSPATRSA